MKTTITLLSLCLVTLIPLVSRAADPAPNLERGICVLDMASTPAFSELPSYVKGNLPVPVRYDAVTLAKDAGADALLARIAAMRKPTDAVVVALVALPGSSLLIVDPDQHVALVNVTALALKNAPKPNVRLGQQTLRGLAAAMGVGFQFDPHCVMQPIKAAVDLDTMGGNFSPPALQQLLMSLANQGVVPPNSRLRKVSPTPVGNK